MRTVVGLFERDVDAETVLAALEQQGIPRTAIGVLVRDRFLTQRTRGGDPLADHTARAAAEGATIGGLGGLLAGVAVLMLPGIGPVLAAGTLGTLLGSALTGAGLGAVTGGALGALMHMGVPEHEAQLYAEGLRRGAVLIAVQVPEQAEAAVQEAMHQSNVLDINARRQEWLGFQEPI